MENKKHFSDALLLWYNTINRQFPWRGINDPYKIWISEIMLQQTQVVTVIDYYNRWMKELPTIKKVTISNKDKILKLWEGLGYYQRAHNIYDSAHYINNKYNGLFPKSYKKLIKCKGIGDYTASAILSIAFSKPYPAIDGNIKRIISRIHLVKETYKIEKISKKFLFSHMKTANPGDINQAMMDLGREICRPTNPNCTICPIKLFCKAYKNNKIGMYPFPKAVITKPSYDVVVGMIWKDDQFFISKRKSTGHLGGLWELPGGKKENKENNISCLKREIHEELNINIQIGEKIGSITHKYSHFDIYLTAYRCQYKKGKIKLPQSQKTQWISPNMISKYAFPKATLKIFELNANKG